MSHFSLSLHILPLYMYYFDLNFDAHPQNVCYNHAVRCHMLHFGVQFQFRSICGICAGHYGTRVGFYSNILISSAIHNLISVLYYLFATHIEFCDCLSQPAHNQFFTCYLTHAWTEIKHISERNCFGFSDADLLI
jgi:hypothetical protein